MDDHLYLVHHGIKGQRWGVRRFQNKNGSLTSAGKRRYDADGVKISSDAQKLYKKAGDYNRFYAEDKARNVQQAKKDAQRVKEGKMTEQKAKERAAHRKEATDEWKQAADETKQVADRTQKYHADAVKYWQNMSAGKKLGTSLLYGPFGAQQYVALRGQGNSALVSSGVTIASSLIGGGSALGNIAVNSLNRYVYARKDLK